MKHAAGIVVTGACLALAGCRVPDATAADRQVLLDFYEAQRAAHFEGDARKFFAAVDTGYWAIGNGEVRYRMLDEAVASVEAYFASTRFDEVRDISPPRVTFSADGCTGWLIGEVAIRGSQRDSTGVERPLAFRAAWMDVYRKGPAGWHLEIRANTERAMPLSPPG